MTWRIGIWGEDRNSLSIYDGNVLRFSVTSQNGAGRSIKSPPESLTSFSDVGFS
jgi:hypothetical protein